MTQVRRQRISWISASALFALCGVLGFLQYRWIGEVSQAERERMAGSLRATLERLSRDFDNEIATDMRALVPPGFQQGVPSAPEEGEIAARFEQWKGSTRREGLFRRIAVAKASPEAVILRVLDRDTAEFHTADWPPEWSTIKARLDSRFTEGPGGRGVPFFRPARTRAEDGLVVEVPLRPFQPMMPGGPPPRFERREAQWLILELDRDYLGRVLLPQVVRRHLGTGGALDYQVEVVSTSEPLAVLYESEGATDRRIRDNPDGSVGLLEVSAFSIAMREWAGRDSARRGRTGPGNPDVPWDPGRGRGPVPGPARFEMFVRHRAGSLEAVVEQARKRNLAVTGGVLLLMAGAVLALFQYTRRAQRLAELEMDFVAGVSHELRTPLTVIHTAAYNLKGKVAQNPAQVEQYGTLIQKESGRLKRLVEQVLDFSRSKTERLVRDVEPLSVSAVVEEVLESERPLIEQAKCQVEKRIDPGLPQVMGDPVALRHAIENLVSNAVKYGAKDGGWIGVSASAANGKGVPSVEIRVEDRGPGIPGDELSHVFEPFFRGRRAINDQVHGTGLGLNLAKKIVEAHGGTIQVESEPKKGTQVVVRIPAAATGAAA